MTAQEAVTTVAYLMHITGRASKNHIATCAEISEGLFEVAVFELEEIIENSEMVAVFHVSNECAVETLIG